MVLRIVDIGGIVCHSCFKSFNKKIKNTSSVNANKYSRFFYIIRQTEELYDKYILPKINFPLSVACVDLYYTCNHKRWKVASLYIR